MQWSEKPSKQTALTYPGTAKNKILEIGFSQEEQLIKILYYSDQT